MINANRVAESSTSTGTGSLTLAGAIAGHQTFGTAFGTGGNTEVHYGIVQGSQWEIGIGTYLGGSNALQRDQVLAGSAGTTKENFPSGSKTVYVTTPADGVLTVKSSRSTDVALQVRAAAGQTAALVQAFNSSGTNVFQVTSTGRLDLSAPTSEMLRIPQDNAGAFVAVRQDMLASPGQPGIRFRWSNTGTSGFLQLSEADAGHIQFQPLTGQTHVVVGTGAGGGAGSGTGMTFVEGIKIKNQVAEIAGASVGHIGLDCVAGAGNTNWDLGPANNTGGTHSVRVGRYSHASSSVSLVVCEPGTTNIRARMTGDGEVIGLTGDFGTVTANGVQFPATQVPSANPNMLDDYEEGTFTPVVKGSTTAGSGTYVSQSGVYTKIGRLVTINMVVTWSAHTGTGNITIDGLPFTVGGSTNPPMAVLSDGLTFSNQLCCRANNGTTLLQPVTIVSTGVISAVAMDTDAGIQVSGSYRV